MVPPLVLSDGVLLHRDKNRDTSPRLSLPSINRRQLSPDFSNAPLRSCGRITTRCRLPTSSATSLNLFNALETNGPRPPSKRHVQTGQTNGEEGIAMVYGI